MLKSDKGAIKAVSVLALICILAALVFSVLSAVTADLGVAFQAGCILNIAALIYAVFYILAGHNKANAAFFKIYGAVFALAQIAEIAGASSVGAGYIDVLLSALFLSAILVLMVSKDLGKQNSLLLCAVQILLAVLIGVDVLSNVGSAAVVSLLVKLLLALLYLLMTVEKYADKTARGSK